jgi:putative PEP-CTERM system TPR-repeat lipoprotein
MTAFAVLVAMSVACGGSPEEFIARGDRFLAEEKYREAAVEYRNAVGADEKSGLARHRLAQALMMMGELSPAVGEFVRAADLLPDDDDVQLDAARALLQAQQFEDARTRAEIVLKREPKHVEALIVRAHALAGLKDFDLAIESMEDAIEIDPTRSASHVRLGALQRLSGEGEVAESAYKHAVALNPQSPGPHLALANYYWRTGQRQNAEAAVRGALNVDKTNVKSNRALARLLLATNRSAEAEAPLRVIAEHSTELPDKLVLADYLALRKRYDEAIVILQQLTANAASATAANVRIAGIRYEQGQPQEAHRLLDALIAEQPNNGDLLVVRGRWQLSEKKIDEALATAQAAINVSPKLAPAHGLLGTVYTTKGQIEDAIKAFNEVVAITPRSLAARVQLARLHLAAGRAEAALDAARDALRVDPTSGDAQFEVARALFATGDLTRAEVELRRVMEVAPNFADVQLLYGELQRRRRNRVEARRAYERALEIDPNLVEALAGLVTLDVGDKQLAQARRRVDAQLQKTPDRAPLLLLAARTYATAGDAAAAEKTLRRAIEVDPAFFPAYNVLGQFYVQRSQLDEARREYEALAAKRPNDVAALTMVGMILQVQGKHDEAQKRYEQILAIDKTAAVAANNLAYMYAESGGNLDIALQLAQTAKASAPDNPDVNDTLGWVYYKRNLASMARDPLEQSAKADPKNATYQYHLGLVYAKIGEIGKARAALEQVLVLQPNFEKASEVKTALAGLPR